MIDAAIRTVDLASHNGAKAAFEEIATMVSGGWRVESTAVTSNAIYYVLRREAKL